MGTSSSFRGPNGKTPLVPSWLEGDSELPNDAPKDGENSPISDADNSSQDGDNTTSNENSQSQNSEPEKNRYTQVRSNFTRFVRSEGSDRRALGRAISGYVSKASGGSKKASQKMGSSKTTTGGLINFLQSVRTQGTENTLKNYGLENLVGHSIQDIFIELMDFICPKGGPLDEGIARNAFVETIAELADLNITNLDNLTVEQIQTIIQIYSTHAIEARLCNDIGTKIFITPKNLSLVEGIQEQLHDFIGRSVSDALQNFEDKFTTLTSAETAKFVEDIYEEAFNMLQILGDLESN